MRPQRTLVYRMVHADNLTTLARRGGLHAPAHSPEDGLPYLAIHDESIRLRRGGRTIPCGPRGNVDDYVSFYLGRRSPMLYRIWKGAVSYEGGQRPVVYLVSSVERLQELSLRFVFSDGHSLSALTSWYDDPAALDDLDWETIQTNSWADTEEDPDRCRRKQAELLVYEFVPWAALLGIAVMDEEIQRQVEDRLRGELPTLPYINIREDWYYRS